MVERFEQLTNRHLAKYAGGGWSVTDSGYPTENPSITPSVAERYARERRALVLKKTVPPVVVASLPVLVLMFTVYMGNAWLFVLVAILGLAKWCQVDTRFDNGGYGHFPKRVDVPDSVRTAYQDFLATPALLREYGATESVIGDVVDQVPVMRDLCADMAQLTRDKVLDTELARLTRDRMFRMAAEARALLELENQRSQIAAAYREAEILDKGLSGAAAKVIEQTAQLQQSLTTGSTTPDADVVSGVPVDVEKPVT